MNQSYKIPTVPRIHFSNVAITCFSILCLTGLLMPSIASCQTWTGATNNDWSVNTNWSTNTVPTSSGTVKIPNTTNKPIIYPGTFAVANTLEVMNGGSLEIHSSLTLATTTATGIINDGTINNDGLIHIGNVGTFLFYGIFSNGFITNTGIIEVTGATTGIFTGGSFNNSETINIGGLGHIDGNGLENNGSFTNNEGGYISVDNSSFGIFNRRGDFTNAGTIDIGSIPGDYNIDNYGIENKANLVNNSSGVINIDRTKGTCLLNEVGTFSNAGSVNLAINYPAGQSAFYNLEGCTLTNKACGILKAFGALYNKGTLSNTGFLTLNNYTGYFSNVNTGTITNDGVLENVLGNDIPGTLINHDMIIDPASGECVMPNALKLGNALSFTAGNIWYSSYDLNSQAGTYNQNTNTFSQSNLVLGENTVYFSVTDNNNGCSYTVSKKITLLPDHTKPIIVCKQGIVDLGTNGSGVLDPAQLFQSGTDNCGGAVTPVSANPNNFTCSQIGQTLYATLTASDESGNTATCTASVTVRDMVSPTMLCKPATIILNASNQATLSIAQIDNGSYDNCSIQSKGISRTLFTCADVGNNPVLLSGIDASGNKGECIAMVSVVDPFAPVARCKNIMANLSPNGTVSIQASAVDNGSSDNCTLSTLMVSPYYFTCENVGPNNVTLRATDGSGNTGTCTTVVTVKDVTPPNALCQNATVFLNDVGQATLSVSQINNGSSDACGIATMALSKTQFNCSDIPGSSQSVTLTLKDVNNNTSSCIAQVTTKDKLAPTAVCQNTSVSLGSNGQVTVYPADLAANSFDNCSVTSYSPLAKVYTAANLGNNNLSITVRDWSGNAATCVSVVTVYPYSGFNGSGNRSDAAPLNQPDAQIEFNMYPNPAAGDVVVAFELEEQQAVALHVYDLSGRIILTQQIDGQQGSNQTLLKTGSMENGLYLVEIQSNNRRLQKRLAVQHN